jgi:uncharacterized protein YicC (UPF0701 family)
MSTVVSPAVRKSIRAKLRRGVVNIFFRKANGQFRSMKCTLNPSLVGYFGKSVRPSASTVKVWSVSDGHWRTIRYDRIISYSYAQ